MAEQQQQQQTESTIPSKHIPVLDTVFVIDARYLKSRGLAPPISLAPDAFATKYDKLRFHYEHSMFTHSTPHLGRSMALGVRDKPDAFVCDVGVLCDDTAPRAEVSIKSHVIEQSRRVQTDPTGLQKKHDDAHTVQVVPVEAGKKPIVRSMLPFPLRLEDAKGKADRPLGVLLSTLAVDPNGEIDPFATKPSPGLAMCKARQVLDAKEIDNPESIVAVVHCKHQFSYLLGTVAGACGVKRVCTFVWPGIKEVAKPVRTDDASEPYLLVMSVAVAKKLVEEARKLRTTIRELLVPAADTKIALTRAVFSPDGKSTTSRQCPYDEQGNPTEYPTPQPLPFTLKFVVTYGRPVHCPDMIVHDEVIPPPFSAPVDLPVHSCVRNDQGDVISRMDRRGDAARRARHEFVQAAFYKHQEEIKDAAHFNANLEEMLAREMTSST